MKYGVAAMVMVATMSAFCENAASARFGGNEIRLWANPLSYEVVSDGVTLVPRTAISLSIAGNAQEVTRFEARKEHEQGRIATCVHAKAFVDLACEKTFVDCGAFEVHLAARPDGVAWRFVSKGGAITDERANITVPDGARCWFHRLSPKKALGCEETVSEAADAKELLTFGDRPFYLPFAWKIGGKVVAVTEADLYEYPAWYLDKADEVAGGVRLSALFAKYPKSVRNDGAGEDRRGRWLRVVESEDYLVKGSRDGEAFTLPWRVFVLAQEPAQLCEADIVYALSRERAEGDFSWVKPGKVAWDWWNDFDNKGTEEGCTTQGYLRFIDFAAANNVEYVILDEGWSEKLNIWKYSPRVDVEKVIKYAESKGVGIILWLAWAQAYGDEERVAEHFARIGVKGFKVDFMDRGDAQIAEFLDRFASACAKRRMIVDYHGVYRPTGMHRKWPNIVNYEGIHGLEQMKWAKPGKDMCANDVGAFFLRQTAGPMDYTPGAMDNYKVGEYGGTYRNPGSSGTRAHQMALMVMYLAPLNMLSDSPTKYEANMECFRFMAATPVVWEETRGLGGTPETFAAVARKAADGAWWAGGIANSQARDFELDTSFLGEGEWEAEIFRDADTCEEKPCEYVHEQRKVKAGGRLALHMARGGGFAIRFIRK